VTRTKSDQELIQTLPISNLFYEQLKLRCFLFHQGMTVTQNIFFNSYNTKSVLVYQ